MNAIRIARLIPLVMIPFLFACFPKRPEIPAAEVAVGPLLQALEQRRLAFPGLKALAGVQATRRGRTRSFESVGVLVGAREKFKIEAYGPLGQVLFTLLVNGAETLFVDAEEQSGAPPIRHGLERLFDGDVEPAEVYAALSGNAPAPVAGSEARAYCGQDGVCMVEIRQGNIRRVVHVAGGPGSGTQLRVLDYERDEGGRPVFRACFHHPGPVSGYLLPRTIFLETPEQNQSITIEYEDADVSAPADDDEFTITETGGTLP